ncbi:hypothetical protein BC828DRAFT_402707 [Blastocladiella britannica]|nr:hypothetical protein BC828DRAFT_402707 [Blastocladiella britannica]
MIDHVAYLILERAASSTRSPEDALIVLNVPPSARAPTVLAAALSRGFLEHKPSLAVKHGLAYLLPHYPSHVLYTHLKETLTIAAGMGALPVLEMLWQLVGPNTLGRAVWFTAQFPLSWDQGSWLHAATNGHLDMVRWGLAHGHLLELDQNVAMASTKANGDMSLFLEWASTISIDELDMTDFLCRATRRGLVKVLDWWWVSVADRSVLPDPASFATITDASQASGCITMVKWWWDRFREAWTPEHTFGSPDSLWYM